MEVEVQPGCHVDTKLRKEPFFPGEQFNLEDEAEARRLIDAGAVKEVKGATSSAGGSGQQLNAAQTIELVKTANAEELAKLKEAETRATVLAAIAKREAELTTPPE